MIEYPATAPTTTINFTVTSAAFNLSKLFYKALGGEDDKLSGRFGCSKSSMTSIKLTFLIKNSTDSAFKQIRDFLLLVAENPDDQDHFRLTMTGSNETWVFDGQIQPLALLIKGGESNKVTGSFTFDVMDEISFS